MYVVNVKFNKTLNKWEAYCCYDDICDCIEGNNLETIANYLIGLEKDIIIDTLGYGAALKKEFEKKDFNNFTIIHHTRLVLDLDD